MSRIVSETLKNIGESVNLNWAISTYDKEGVDALVAEAEKEIEKL